MVKAVGASPYSRASSWSSSNLQWVAPTADDSYNGSLDRSQHPGAARRRRSVLRRARPPDEKERERETEKGESVWNSKSNKERSESRERPRDTVRAFSMPPAWTFSALCASTSVRATRGSPVFFSLSRRLFPRLVSANPHTFLLSTISFLSFFFNL